MDALHVTERTELEFASQNEGVMHACGHDCHMAMMLGAVRMLMELRGRLRGEVRVIFQPAEEISIGARDMIAAGALEGVDAIYGAHIWSEVDAGVISCEAGPRMAFTDWFRIDIEGVSAHGSMPHKGVDAIVIAAEIVDALQVIVSRRTSPFEPVVITVGEIHGGTARNVMAGSAYLTGTLRTWHSSVRDRLIDRIERVAGKTSHAFGAEVRFSFEEGNPSVVNDPACSEAARKAVAEVLGEGAIGLYEGTLAGEDYAEYLQHVPGVFVFVGTNNPDVGAVHPQHSCYYTVDESVLVKGSMVAAQWACDMLE
jgi:amidohydrolase